DVTVSIASKGDVTEDQPIVFEVSVSQPLDRDLTVKLSTGDVVIIPEGETSVDYTLPAQGDDVYKDGEDITVGLTDATVVGAEFENLVLGGEATVSVSDTIDTTTATLTSAGSGDEDNGSVTYTVTLDHAPQHEAQDFKLTLSNDQEVIVTVAAGTTTGSVTLGWGSGLTGGAILLKDYPDSDVYKEPDFTLSAELAVSGTGGNFEKLVVDNQSTGVTISDTI
ncbi:immunoglobulin-like domain-containing protein, partial [Orrella sp. 11846]|uniref:immunoglobulin-like domain-containing protein n=1 Tax=Orrella sp. 11846 TaxID=3409913 RepID=UPI003B5A6C5C